jgi:hypothetical protein
MDNMKYSIKIKGFHKVGTLLLLLIIVCLVIYLLLSRIEGSTFYILLISLITSILSSIGLFKRPIEIQVFEGALNFKGILGQEKFISIKDLNSFEESFAKTLFLKSRKEKILTNGFPEISRVIVDIKKSNPNFSIKGV